VHRRPDHLERRECSRRPSHPGCGPIMRVRLDAPELLTEVAEGVAYVNGLRVKSIRTTPNEKAA